MNQVEFDREDRIAISADPLHAPPPSIQPNGNSSTRVLESPMPVIPVDSRYVWQLLSVIGPLLLADLLSVVLVMGFCDLVVTYVFGRLVNHFVLFTGVVSLTTVANFASMGLYPGIGLHIAVELRQCFRGIVMLGLVMGLGLALHTSGRSPYLSMLLLGIPLLCIAIPLGRWWVRATMRRMNLGVPFFFMGAAKDVEPINARMCKVKTGNMLPLGRFGLLSDYWREEKYEKLLSSQGVPYLGTLEDIPSYARERGVYWLVVVAPKLVSHDLEQKIDVLRSAFPHVVFVHPSEGLPSLWTSVMSCGGAAGVRFEEPLLLPWQSALKRTMDIVVSFLGLMCLAPLLALLALLVKLDSKGPVFFGHKRIGKDGRVFRAWKFRSMVENAEEVLKVYLANHPELKDEWEKNTKLKEDPRVTKLGEFLRKTSLDELPQLWNILIGEMSLVGPRPILLDEPEKYGSVLKHYLRVRPGLTGLWQISGRNSTSYEDRLSYVQFYVRNWSPWFDIYILIRTVKTVCNREGAY